MKRNIYLICISILTIIIILGVCFRRSIHFVSPFAFPFVFHEYNRDYQNETKNSIQSSYELDAFNRIDIDCSVAEITIKEGSSFYIEYKCTQQMIPNISVEHNTLTITQNRIIHTHMGNNNCSIILTVPSDTDFEKLEVKTDVGDVFLNSICANDAYLNTDVGEIAIERGVFHDLMLRSSTGDVILQKADFVTLNSDTSVGDVSIDVPDTVDSYSYDLITEMGEVELFGQSYSRKFFTTNNSDKSIEIRNEIGDINIF